MLRRAIPLVLLLATAACGGQSEAPPPTTTTTQPPPPPAPFETGAAVRMTGFDPVTGNVEVQQINAWTSAQRTSLECRVAHGAEATVKAREFLRGDDRWYFEIESGPCTGWVPASFLEAR